MFLSPGSTTFQYLNFSNNSSADSESKYFMGDNARLNLELAALEKFNLNYESLDVVDLTKTQYKDSVLTRMQEAFNQMEDEIRKFPISKKAVWIKKRQIELGAYGEIAYFDSKKLISARRGSPIPPFQKLDLSPQEIGPEFYDFIDPDILNDKNSLMVNTYFYSLRRLKNTNIAINKLTREKGNRLRYLMPLLQEFEINLPAPEQKLLAAIDQCDTDDCVNYEIITDSITWNRIYNSNEQVSQLMQVSMQLSATMDRVKPTQDLLQQYLALEPGLALDLILMQSIGYPLYDEYRPFYEVEKEILKENVTDQELLNHALAYNRSLEDEIARRKESLREDTRVVINSTDGLDKDQLFEGMMDKYKGKVVLVDFWATWCRPCRSSLERMQPLKEEMKEKVEFVYITNHTTSERAWNLLLPDMEGEHFKLEKEEWEILQEKFDFRGIPHYILLDKKGAVVRNGHHFASNNYQLKKIMERFMD